MQMQIDKKRMAVIVTISLLFSVVVLLSTECFLLAKEVASVRSCLKAQQANTKAELFTKLFINKVLLSTSTISFDDRLDLENAIRDLSEKEIFDQWQKFINSKNDAETQIIVGNMLKALISKISS